MKTAEQELLEFVAPLFAFNQAKLPELKFKINADGVITNWLKNPTFEGFFGEDED